MWHKTAMVVALAAISGCMTAEDRRAADEAKCRSYGFARKNDAFAECLQRIDLARRAELKRVGFRSLGPARDLSAGHPSATAKVGRSNRRLSV